VERFVPGWDRRITVRMLLDHSSGLRSWGNKDDPDTAHADLVAPDLARRFSPAESLEPVRAAPLLAEPGTRTHYSNANTILAGEVVTAVTGLSIGAAIDRFVVRPLHLTSTGYAPEGLDPRPGVSGVLYLDDARTVEIETAQYPMTSLLTLSGPSIGVVSDAPDLLAFASAFLRGRFPTTSLARRAQRITRGGAGLGIIGFTPAGYCIFDGCVADARYPRRGFAGNVDGGAVRVVYDPQLDVTVLVFVDSSQRGRLDPFVLRTFRTLRAG
jgi:D-alanyl-D-alanine carboxypeptidase